MLEDQNEGSEHDNDIGDDTDQDDDHVTSSDEGEGAVDGVKKEKRPKESKAARNARKASLRYDTSKVAPSKTRDNEPGPLEPLIEFIMGDRWPTSKEYNDWLHDEEDRRKGTIVNYWTTTCGNGLLPAHMPAVINAGMPVIGKITGGQDAEKRKIDQQTKSLINSIVAETARQAEEDKFVTIDVDEPEELQKKKAAEGEEEEKKKKEYKKGDEEMKDETTKEGESPQTLNFDQKDKVHNYDKRPKEMQYLIKIKNQCFRKCRWINESEFFE